MDVFIEQIIKRKITGKDKLIMLLLLLAAAVLSFLAITLLPAVAPMLSTISIFVVAGLFYGAWRIITNYYVEFEYAITNGDITVDKIIYRRKRKRVVSVDAKEVEAMGKYNAAEHQHREYGKRLIAAKDPNDAENSWYITFHNQEFGNTILVFTPDERTLGAIKPFLKRQVSIDAFCRH